MTPFVFTKEFKPLMTLSPSFTRPCDEVLPLLAGHYHCCTRCSCLTVPLPTTRLLFWNAGC